MGNCAQSTYRGVVQVKMGFLDALAVVSLGVGETEQAFLEKIAKTGSVTGG